LHWAITSSTLRRDINDCSTRSVLPSTPILAYESRRHNVCDQTDQGSNKNKNFEGNQCLWNSKRHMPITAVLVIIIEILYKERCIAYANAGEDNQDARRQSGDDAHDEMGYQKAASAVIAITQGTQTQTSCYDTENGSPDAGAHYARGRGWVIDCAAQNSRYYASQ